MMVEQCVTASSCKDYIEYCLTRPTYLPKKWYFPDATVFLNCFDKSTSDKHDSIAHKALDLLEPEMRTAVLKDLFRAKRKRKLQL